MENSVDAGPSRRHRSREARPPSEMRRARLTRRRKYGGIRVGTRAEALRLPSARVIRREIQRETLPYRFGAPFAFEIFAGRVCAPQRVSRLSAPSLRSHGAGSPRSYRAIRGLSRGRAGETDLIPDGADTRATPPRSRF